MKKILTLMAAASVCSGTAVASDFNFANPASDAKKVNSALSFDETANSFSFTVTEGDSVTIEGTGDIAVTIGTTSLTPDGNKYFAAQGGTMIVTLGNNANLTKIFVESSNARKVQEEIDKAQQVMGEQIAAVAPYVSFLTFYNKVQAEISKAGQKVQDVKAKLAEYKESNGLTDDKATALIAELNSETLLVDGNYGAIKMAQDAVEQAKVTFQLYQKITMQDAQEYALNSLDKADTTPTVNEWRALGYEKTNNTTIYTRDFESVKNNFGVVVGVKPTDFKTSWIETEWKSLKDTVNTNIKSEADAELDEFPNAFVGKDESYFINRYKEVVAKLQNVIARANFERDYKGQIEGLSTKVEKVEAALNVGTPFALADENDFRMFKEQIAGMQAEINETQNRYQYEQTDFAAFGNSIQELSSKLDGFYAELVVEARKDLEIKLGAAQANLTKVSYEVSAKYENEPNTQVTYQQQFSAQQNKLNDLKQNVANSQFEKVQDDYAAFVKAIETINDSVNSIWGTTLSDQKQEILTHNQQAKDNIFEAIDAVRADYTIYVDKINTWINDETTKSAATDLKANLNKLFSIINGLDDMKAEVTAAVNEMTDNIKNESDEEFGAHYEANQNIYRLTDDKVKAYLKSTKSVADQIYAELIEAAKAANVKAYNYVMNQYHDNTIEWAKAQINDGKSHIQPGTKNQKMSVEAVAKFAEAYDKIGTKDSNGQGEGYIQAAQAEIDRLNGYDVTKEDFKNNILADKIVKDKDGVRELPEKMIAPVKVAVDNLTEELESYKNQYDSIYTKKVDWNLAKAHEDELQAEVDAWEKANNVSADKHFNVNKELTLVNDSVASALAYLETGCLTAQTRKEATDKALAYYNEKMYVIRHFTEAKANEAAAPVVSAKVAEVTKAIADARTAVEVYVDDIKAKANIDLDEIANALEKCKEQIDASVAANSIAANKDGFIANLDKLVADVAKVLKDAEEASHASNLDYNGDGEVNVKDLVDADADFQESGDGATFYKFLDAYLEYLGK